MTSEYRTGIGIMSGTSLDGLDLAWCTFTEENGRWRYQIERAVTVPYDVAFRKKLALATEMSALAYAQLDIALGTFIADRINEWIQGDGKPDFIASHGHTVFHQPAEGLTTQIGSGAVIAARTGIVTICDFRTGDVALGGQGAPLVPIGDELLFGQYDACLNLGGFCNISFRQGGQRVAFDIAPCNMALNFLAQRLGFPYDHEGHIANTGSIVTEMLNELNTLDYYQHSYPKSLGKEWFEGEFLPIIEKHLTPDNTPDCLRTIVEHIAIQVSAAAPSGNASMMVSGGGALNNFLVERIRGLWPGNVIIPDALTIEYKEALIFAFLGMLRLQGKANCLASVTGAKRDNCGGAVYFV